MKLGLEAETNGYLTDKEKLAALSEEQKVNKAMRVFLLDL